jgi:glycosyltransferase involved in cell wall biosynthesis
VKLLVWQWGRIGGGPRYGAELADSLRRVDGCEVVLSLSAYAEILTGAAPPRCEIPIRLVQASVPGLLGLVWLPWRFAALVRAIRAAQPDVAICAMPGMFDLLMVWALRLCGVTFLVVVHDAELHPGDGRPFQMRLQRALIRAAAGVITLSEYVAERLEAQHALGRRPLIRSVHPPRPFHPPPPPVLAHGGKLRLLFFGRLLPYKGIDLLVEALKLLGPRDDFVLRVVGSGPESAELRALAALPGVTVENRWVPEDEIGALLAWSDALVLSHREASQSGGAAAAVAARRFVVATEVGAIPEQLRGEAMARLCPPDAPGIAAALRDLLDNRPAPLPLREPPEAAWTAMAARLVADIRAALKPAG